MKQGKLPYQELGQALSALRQKAAESLAEASGAVEIDSDRLSQFESGELCPSEDILLLLATHFAIDDDETTKLLDLAGYNQQKVNISDELPLPQTTVMVLPFEPRIVYTDIANITVNEFGVIMNFMQQGAPGSQPIAVSRVGMSHEHAKKVLEVLQATLSQAAPRLQKSLPAPKKSSNDTSKG